MFQITGMACAPGKQVDYGDGAKPPARSKINNPAQGGIISLGICRRGIQADENKVRSIRPLAC